MNSKIEKNSHSVEETEQIAADFFKILSSSPSSATARVIGLYGNLGSGKTVFAKAIGKILGVEETIQSPTFVLQKIYDTKDPIFKKLYHLDFYRIEDPEELKILRLEEIFNDPQNLVLIEWPEKVEQKEKKKAEAETEEKKDQEKFGILPRDLIKVNFRFIDDITRKISYDI